MTQSCNNFRVIVVRSIEELKPFLADLDDLTRATSDQNVFYEPWMLVPAMRWLANGTDVRLVLVSQPGTGEADSQLCGFFPLEILPRYNHFPVKTARIWRHKFCYLCTPLLRQGKERETLSAFFEWSATQSNDWRIIEFGWGTGSGVLHELLVQATSTPHRFGLVDVRFTRPLLRCALTADAYFQSAVSVRHKKDMEKKEKKLRGLGQLEYVAPVCSEEAAQWIERFLELEASGWRGRKGVDVASHPAQSGFMREAMNAAYRFGKLDLLGLRLNSDLIALKINLACRGGSFAFMITFDERYSTYSPGLLLEMENIRRIHENSRVDWMDSCADQNSVMFNRIWSDKRVIETLLVSNQSSIGDAWIALIPLGHWMRRIFSRIKRPRSGEPSLAQVEFAGPKLSLAQSQACPEKAFRR